MPPAAPVSRRQTLALLSASALIPALPLRRAGAEAPLAGVARSVEVAPGVHVHSGEHALVGPKNGGDISNATFVIGTAAVAVIDTGGSLQNGAALRRAISAVTSLPVRFVINTHMHPDHVFGNAAFEADKPDFVGHHKLAKALSARAESYLRRNRDMIGAEAFEGSKIIVPTKPVQDTMELDLGGRTLLLRARPTAHTDNDLTVFDSATRTLILGDLAFDGHIPTIDGSIAGWLRLMQSLRQEKADRAVPGHGGPVRDWPQVLDATERYLQTVADGVRAMLKAGKTISEATASVGFSEKDKWQVFDEHHARNVTAAFAELEWE